MARDFGWRFEHFVRSVWQFVFPLKPKPDHLMIERVDDLIANWKLKSKGITGPDVWLCPRCDHGEPYEKPEKCGHCGWFKPTILDLLAREGDFEVGF